MSYRYPKLDPNIDGLLARNEMEYPTEDVSFVYLAAIDKIERLDITSGGISSGSGIIYGTSDSFTDKSIQGQGGGNYPIWLGRYVDGQNYYFMRIGVPDATNDFGIRKVVSGTTIELSSESVDLSDVGYLCSFSNSGSTLKGFRIDMVTPKLTTTDTSFTNGKFGIFSYFGESSSNRWTDPFGTYLRPPSTQLPPAQRILEFEITGTGSEDDPIRPNFSQNIQDHPEFGKIDTLTVTWGAFDYKYESTILAVITGDNYYQQGAILEQESYVKNKNLKVFRPPRDLLEAKQLHSQIKSERPDIIAGSHNLAYQCIGHPDLEPLAVADFYDGFVQGTYNIKELDKVPQWELERTIKMWEKRLELSSITSTEKDKHFPRLRSVIKV
jgi:hypothetical protein